MNKWARFGQQEKLSNNGKQPESETQLTGKSKS